MTPPHGMGGSAVTRLSEDLAYVEQLVANSATVRNTRWESYTLNGQLWIKVEGAGYEAHAWRAVLGGRAFPSSIDSHGVRRQMVIGTRVCAEVIEIPVVES
jgi:hypothetical protein